MLSEGQKGFWALASQPGAGAAYHCAYAARLRGELDRPALERSLAALTARHQSLRAAFPLRGGRPTQAFAEPEEGFAGLESGDAGVSPAEAMRRPFDLERGPLFRATLWRLGPREHALLLCAHHIVVDRPSWDLLVRELGELYALAEAGRAPSLASPAPRYSDYVRWQRALLAGETGGALRRAWLEELSGALPLLALPTDRRRRPEEPWAGRSTDLDLDAAFTRKARACAARGGKTLYAVLLSAYAALLHRYGGQEEVVIGCPTVGSRSPRFEALVGSLVNPVALRCDLSDDPSAARLLARLQAKTLAAVARRDYPFPALVRELRPPRESGRTPVFQTSLNLVDERRRPSALGSLRLEPLDLPQQEGQFDLDLLARERAEGLSLRLRYDGRLFDESTASRMLRRYRLLLEGLLDDPERRVGALALLAPRERAGVLAGCRGRALPRAPATLHGLVEAQARRSPDAPAARCGDEQWTFRQLDEKASALARRLRAAGAGPDAVVAVLLERSLDMVAAFLGVLKAGAAYLPLEPQWPDRRLDLVLEDSRAALLLTRDALARRVSCRRARVLSLEDAAAGADGAPPPGVEPRHAAYVIYTSGSTGKPKGVVNVHAGICNRLLWMQEEYRLGADDVVLQKTPATFDVSVWEIFWPLIAGARLVLAEPGAHRDPAALARLIRRENVTTAHFVPPMLRAFLDEPASAGCSSLRRVICSGDVLSPALQRRFFSRLRAELHNLYGPTEASIDVTAWRCSPDDDATLVPIGRPIANTSVYVLDSAGEVVPPGVAGELFIGGVGVARGYLNRPDLTAERFRPDPFADGGVLYRSGDLARWRPDGALEFLGRRDHQVKIRGVRVEPSEVAAAVEEHPAVGACAVVASGEGEEKRLIAYVVARGDRPAPSVLREFLARGLPDALVPSAFVFLDALPTTPTGKLDRAALPPPAPEPSSGPPRAAAGRDRVERLLLRIWSEVLRRRGIGPLDDFFELGGDSLTSVEVALRAAREGLELGSNDVLRHKTVAALAEALRRRERVAPPTANEG